MICYKNLTLCTEIGVLKNAWIKIKEDRIFQLGTSPLSPNEGVDLRGAIMLPGFIDQHIHGALGVDVMDGTPKSLDILLSYLPQEGVTSILATTMTAEASTLLGVMENIRQYQIKSHPKKTKILGIHLEGPFISPQFKGAQNPLYLLSPSIELMDKLQLASGNQIRMVTYAPELDNEGKFITYLKSAHIVPSLGHTSASYRQCLRAIDQGAAQFTHLYNAMSPFHHRQPGAVAAALAPTSASVELICDGVHVNEDIVELTYKLKGAQKITLISDAIRGKGMKEGVYDLGGQSIQVSSHRATLSDGTLAGSVLNYSDGVRRFQKLSQCSLEELSWVTSFNSARRFHLDHEIGSIAEGKIADLVVLNEQLEVQLTIINGQVAFEKK